MNRPDLLQNAAIVLLGERWQRPMARLLAVDDRLLRRWLAGERRMPDRVLPEVRRILARQAANLLRAAETLDELQSDT